MRENTLRTTDDLAQLLQVLEGGRGLLVCPALVVQVRRFEVIFFALVVQVTFEELAVYRCR